jgi:hypothetical protein
VAPKPEPEERLLVAKVRAAELLSISIDSFERLVMPEVRTVRIGRRVLVAVDDLARWVDEHTARPLLAKPPHEHRRDARAARFARRSLSPRSGANVQHATTRTGRRGIAPRAGP